MILAMRIRFKAFKALDKEGHIRGGMILLGCLLVLTLIGSGFGGKDAAVAAEPAEALVDCNIQSGGCTKALGARQITLDIQPKPVKALALLKFSVTVSGEAVPQAPLIDLDMPEMPMGPNIVKLRRTRDRVFEGEGFIVKCPSGSRVWRATVSFPELGMVEYTFHVVY